MPDELYQALIHKAADGIGGGAPNDIELHSSLNNNGRIIADSTADAIRGFMHKNSI
jgi:hypothetical protein